MYKHTISTGFITGIASLLVSTCVTAHASDKGAKAFFANDQRARIEGVWDSSVTVHVCGDPRAELRTFRALNLFEQDGSLVATSVAVPPPSLGKWQWLGGRKYHAEFRFLRLDPAGDFAGSQHVTRSIEMGATRDDFTSVVRIEVFGIDDKPLGAAGCALESAHRVL